MGLLRGFSVGAVMKRMCKAVLKKGLGEFFLGDLDLDQLDLQLTRGTLELTDLALNAEFINAQLSRSPFMVKEGSIKSLLVKFPLQLKSCEIVVEDLELVLAPSVPSEVPPVDAECSVSGNSSGTQTSVNTNRNESDKHCSTSASRDVDEGVKRIANAVKWFLTNFKIKFKNTYIVFDPQTSLDNKVSEFNRSLVFRVKEIEFGTNLSTDGLVKLNNFVTFREAVIEFLKMDHVDVLLQNNSDRAAADISSGHSTTSVLTGPIGGFSGTLNLSIPWSNGCLNLKKIDADVSVDSLELLLQISSIQWFIYVLDSLHRNQGEHNSAHNTADMSLNTSRSALNASKSVMANREDLDQIALSQNRQDKYQDSFLTKAHVIQDWIPELVVHEDQGEPDSDCDESIDQFFECFEELRNSQTNLGNSGIWDWTCSVFNAITFASTLASGSDQVPKEPPIEKTVRASIAEISVILLLNDEMDAGDSSASTSLFHDMRSSEMFSSCLSSGRIEQSMMSPATASSLNMHHLEAKCQNIHLELETYPRNLGFKASVAHMKLDEYYSTENTNSTHSHLGTAFLNNNFCREVQAALPQFPFAAQDYCVETAGRFSHNSDKFIKVELLKTFGECTFHYDVSNTDQDGNSGSSTSLSIHLAPLILWVHFHTVFMVLKFISKVKSDLHGEHKLHRNGDEKNSKLANTSSSESLKVQIAPSHARIILCFPYEPSWDLSRPSILDKFLVLDHTLSQKAPSPLRNERSNDGHPSTPSTSLHLATGNFDIYFIKPVGVLDGRIGSLSRQTFSALKILSVTRSEYHDSSIRMIRKSHPVTCPEMVNKVWSLPNLHDQKITQKENNKWVGVASSTTSQDLVESSFTIRQELIQSTEFLMHVQLPCVSVHLNKKDCGQLNQLLDLIVDGLSDVATGSSENGKDKNSEVAIQTSVIFECSMLDICTELDETVEVSPSLQTELEGSWNRLKLSVSKLSLCSFSNVGGVNNSSFLWVNHGEGELWGSVSGTDDQTCEESKDFQLVICKDSASQRGDGEGNNVLSFGTAGCSVTHIRNPKLQENYISVNVRSGTLVAPGGRMDWISAISLLFSSGSSGSEQSSNSSSTNSSQAGEPFWSSFFLQLADVALSYEPHRKNSTLGAEAPDCKSFSCLLAASSFKLHSKSASDSAATDFDIQLRDLGLLICGSSGSKNVTCGYDVDYLRQMGYAKIGHNTFVEAALRIDTSFWKLEISESQFDIGTCRDSTYGLVHLVSQLQKLYAPDMRDALVHLQSRWNIVQQANTQNMATDASDMSENSTDSLADSAESKSDGLLDDIIDNAFYSDQANTTYNFWDRNCHNSFSNSEVNVEYEMSMINPEATDACVSHISLGSSLVTPADSTAQIPQKQNSCPDHIIDSYYMPDLLNSSSSSRKVNHQCTSGDDACKAVDCDDGGWYSNTPLTIVENHVSKRNNPHGEHVFQQEGDHAVRNLNSDESCNLKGQILIHDIDVKWRMYAGDDWSLAENDLTSRTCSNGRDRSSSLEFIVSGLSMQFDMYPDGDVSVSKLAISAQDLNLCDQNTHAPWKMVLGCYDSKDYPRESCSPAFKLELESVRPEPEAPLEDYRLCLEILPLQLHLDQGQLNFLISFFQNESSNSNPHLFYENEIVGMDSTTYGSAAIVDEALLPFFQKFDVKPLVLHINYIPRQFDPIALGKGNYAELLNILPWKGIDLKLKNVSAMGVYGWNSICETVAAEWLEDISKNQVHKLLKGLPPIKSLVAVGSGTKKLVSLPFKSYKKDRKLLKGMQRGAVAFIRSVSIEAVGLGVHLAGGAHDLLLKTERALTAVPPPSTSREARKPKDNIRANQPEGAHQGLKQVLSELRDKSISCSATRRQLNLQEAYESLTDGLGRTASALIGNPIKVYNRGGGPGSVLATAICGAPAAAVAPVSASARAVHYALLGLRNSLDPAHKKESAYKYSGPSQS